MKEELTVFCGILLAITVTSQCPSDVIEGADIGCVAIEDETTSENVEGRSRCYYLYKPNTTDTQNTQLGWTREEASQICSCLNKTAPDVMSEDVRIIVSEKLRKIEPKRGIWLMGQKEVKDKWVNNQMISIETSDLITNGDAHECAYVIKEGTDVKLKPEKCSSDLRVICQKDDCEMSQSDCLDISASSNYTWFEGRTSCKDKLSDILSFKDVSALSGLGSKLQAGVKYWVGLRKAVWHWNETTEIEKFYWAPDQPTSKGESCLSMKPDGGWEAVSCSSQRYALCWQDKEKDDPSPQDLGAIIGGSVAALVIILIVIVVVVIVLLTRKRGPISEKDFENVKRKKHIKKRKTEKRTEDGVRLSDISENLNMEEINSQGI